MKKSTLTEDKAEQTPTGGVLVGKRKGQTIIHNKGTLSGYLVGKTHAEGGIKAVNKSTGQPLEMQGGEVVITAPAVSDQTKNNFNGKMMTNREILSQINVNGGGVAFAKGGDIPKDIKRTGASYKYGGKTMTDHEIYKRITGGHLAEGMTLPQIAKMHKVSVKELQKQVDMGMKAESEHTSSKREQMKIVKDHLFENPKYYTLLKKAGLEDGGILKVPNVSHTDLKGKEFTFQNGKFLIVDFPNKEGAWKKGASFRQTIKHFTSVIKLDNVKTDLDSILFKKFKKPYFVYDDYFNQFENKPSLSLDGNYKKMIDTLNYELKSYATGGRVHKESLVRDAKSGNTPARDLNNYNDVLDLDADGMVGAETGLYAKGGIVITSVKDIPNFEQRLNERRVSYRGLGAGKLSNDFYELAGENGTRIKVDGKEYFITETEFNKFSRDSNGRLRVRFEAPERKYNGGSIKPYDANMEGDSADMMFATGGGVKEVVEYITIGNYSENPYEGLEKVKFYNFFAFKIFIKDLYANEGITNKRLIYLCVNNDDSFSEANINVSQGKNTNKNFNPFTGSFDAFFKNINDKIVATKYDWNRWGGVKTSASTPSQTSKQIDLLNKKIWVKGNPDLSRRVQELGFANGFVNSAGKTVTGTQKGNIYFAQRHTGDKYMYILDYDKDAFDKESEIEVFESDLFPTETTATTSTELPDFINISDKDAVKDLPQPLQDLIVYELLLDGTTEKGIEFTLKSSTINGAVDWAKSKDGVDFWINTSNGNLLQFKEKYGKSGEKATQLLAELKAKKSGTPAKKTEKIEVFRLIGLSEDGISSTWLHSATELLENLKLLESTFPEKQNFSYRIYDKNGVDYHSLNIGRGIKTPAELITYIMSKPYYEDFDWTYFFAFGTATTPSSKFSDAEIDMFNQIDAIVEKNLITDVDVIDWMWDERYTEDFDIVNTVTGEVFTLRAFKKNLGVMTDDLEIEKSKALIKNYLEFKKSTPTATTEIVEQPKPSKTEKPKRNFELERKYLTQRISDLAKELELKKPILSNEEVAFYQREINSFILKLRKLNDAEMSLKSIEDRVRGVYGLKISALENEYPETDMVSINGLKSQLTEKEYFNVRTPEFKSFFGDWETAYLTDNYAGVSKVINPVTKEPQTVFHGTNVLFVNWQTYETNNAHYFAVKREFSEFFATTWEERTDKAGVDSQILKRLNPNRGSFLLRCFIDVKNPIDFSRFGVEKYPIREFLTFLRVNYNIGDFDFWTNITTHSGITQDTEVYAWQIIRLWQSFTKYVKVFTTYDGYIFYEYIPTKTYGGLENASLSYCAFDSNQIKFTDAYEFNALSNDSRFDLGGIL